ncbi:thioredoxin family protein [Haliscomenobacter sp.]|uniref:thioredoxin family protein n=1 Tax=Haliscomenobacter sp. TaxID=2717303 RepID=UPI003365149D
MRKLTTVTSGMLLVFTLVVASQKLRAAQFLNLPLAEAKARAAQLKRPLFVHFYASWCLPCQWMEANTFIDPEVSAYMNNDYLAVKIDVDEVQGYADRETCGVKFLPSMLIFNASGVAIARFEETINAVQLLDQLRHYNTPENRVVSRTSTVSTVENLEPDKLYSAYQTNNEVQNLSADLEDDPAMLDAQRNRTLTQSNTSNFYSRKMGVQVGVYSSYENVVQQVRYLEKKFNTPVNISSSNSNGQTYYHLIAGPFKTPALLENYLNALQREGIKGVVKDLGQ